MRRTIQMISPSRPANPPGSMSQSKNPAPRAIAQGTTLRISSPAPAINCRQSSAMRAEIPLPIALAIQTRPPQNALRSATVKRLKSMLDLLSIYIIPLYGIYCQSNKKAPAGFFVIISCINYSVSSSPTSTSISSIISTLSTFHSPSSTIIFIPRSTLLPE
jgi:hypothetical protein